ncbi:MAG: hypothetical protein K8R11_03060 [Methanococcoides sp.]|nr:hypothetical protein [Methanococcoides sp.]
MNGFELAYIVFAFFIGAGIAYLFIEASEKHRTFVKAFTGIIVPVAGLIGGIMINEYMVFGGAVGMVCGTLYGVLNGK